LRSTIEQGAALYNRVWTSSVKPPGDFGIALGGIVVAVLSARSGAAVYNRS
jgi:hypothetical protein